MRTPYTHVREEALTTSSSSIARIIRVFGFPFSTNIWPILLFVSQKAFVIPGLILTGYGDRLYRRDLALALTISFVGGLVYATQYQNSYDQVHFIGFILFVWSIPLINKAVREDIVLLRKILTYITLFNAVMGFFLLVSSIDLYGLRGLNKVVGTDGSTHRVYFESSSLAAVALFSTFRPLWLRLASLLLVSAFVIFVSRSVVLIFLLGANLAFPYIIRSSLPVKVAVAIITVVLGIALIIYVPVLRPDIWLSLDVKQHQLDIITGSLDSVWSGWGWGTFYPQLVNDIEQPYQIEMQLPMLILQLGPVATFLIMALILVTFYTASEKMASAWLRFLVYMLIGFNNPWLLVPSWYLTCQLLFRYSDD